jgi:hypothetical protein
LIHTHIVNNDKNKIIVQRVYIYIKEENKLLVLIKFENRIGYVERKESLSRCLGWYIAFARTKNVLPRRNKAYSKPRKRY